MSVPGIADSQTSAYGEVADRFAAIFASEVVAVPALTYVPTLYYRGVPYPDQPPSKLHGRLEMLSAGVKKRTLSRPSRVTHQGTVTVLIKVPTDMRSAALNGGNIADIVQTGFTRGKTNSVYFYNSYVRVAPDEARFYVWRVSSTYTVDIYEG